MAIGKLFHIIHLTGDLPSLEAWYDDVFGVRFERLRAGEGWHLRGCR